MTKRIATGAALLLVALSLAPAFAGAVLELTWADLQPVVEFEDPFENLTADQLYNLGIVARVRELQKADKAGEASVKEAEEAAASLTAEGIDIDGLLARRAEIREKRRGRAMAVVGDLDSRTVTMGGFVLPLEFSGRKVIEFLLVPWVGACIHTPPPPPNQIVHVVLDEKAAWETRGNFEPVTVTGTMFTKAATKNLFLKDGSADISIGYTMAASLVEPYRAKGGTR